MTTEELWDAFTRAGVMIHCTRYGGPDEGYGDGYRVAVDGEVIYCPENVRVIEVPVLFTTCPVPAGSDPLGLAARNAVVAGRVLAEVVRRTNLTFRFSGDGSDTEFEFDGFNPTVSVEPDESVELDGMPVTVVLCDSSDADPEGRRRCRRTICR